MCGNLRDRVAIRRALRRLKTMLPMGKETREARPSWAKPGVTQVWRTRQSRAGGGLLAWEQEEPWIEKSHKILQVFHIKGKHRWQRNNTKELEGNRFWGSLYLKIKPHTKMRFSSTRPKGSFKNTVPDYATPPGKSMSFTVNQILYTVPCGLTLCQSLLLGSLFLPPPHTDFLPICLIHRTQSHLRTLC